MASANRPDFVLRELNSLSNLTLVGERAAQMQQLHVFKHEYLMFP